MNWFMSWVASVVMFLVVMVLLFTVGEEKTKVILNFCENFFSKKENKISGGQEGKA